ncbi:MAG: tetratricopeptide repeat protein [Candidatus Omnitrophota bacterium]|nr:tetratricopeptide repeat protein [Candidatus Omnitrophota bacterium]
MIKRKDKTSVRGVFACLLVICINTFFVGCASKGERVFIDTSVKEKVKFLTCHLKKNPDDVFSRLSLGRLFFKEEMLVAAKDQFERVIAIAPGNAEGYLLLSRVLYRAIEPDYSHIIVLLEKARAVSPEDEAVRLNLGLAYDKEGRWQEAEAALKKAVSLASRVETLLSARLGLMVIYKRQGNQQAAAAEYEAARGIYPDVEDVIQRVEVNRIVPSPAYQGTLGRDGIHDLPEDRAARLEKKFLELEE